MPSPPSSRLWQTTRPPLPPPPHCRRPPPLPPRSDPPDRRRAQRSRADDSPQAWLVGLTLLVSTIDPCHYPPAPARAVVTGASQNIGGALATELAARGHSLIVTARREEVLAEVWPRGLTERYRVGRRGAGRRSGRPGRNGTLREELADAQHLDPVRQRGHRHLRAGLNAGPRG